MIVGVYSIRDIRNGYLSPVFEQNDASAMRNFGNACMQKGNVLNNFPEDFELFKIGDFDSELGKITNLDIPKAIAKGLDFVKKE